MEIAACDVEAQGAVFQEEAGGTGKAGAVSCVGEFYVGFGQRNDDSFVMFIFRMKAWSLPEPRCSARRPVMPERIS